MGFEQRYYRNFDSQVKVMRQVCDEVLEDLGVENNPLFMIARRLEKMASEYEYLIARRLWPRQL